MNGTTGGTMPLFDHRESQRRKRQGIARASEFRQEILERARAYAREIASANGTVTADAVAKAMPPHMAVELAPAAGALFKHPDFVWTGEWHVSTRASNHGRLQRVWRLK